MTDFDYDVRQKKQLVPSARRRVNGSKSKKCSLPSDHLTPGQLARLSGPCVTIRMNEPIAWADFKPLPDNLKREYLAGLRDRYHVSQARVAKMMGASTGTICMLYARLKIDAMLPPATPEERRQYREAWNRFLSGDQAEDIAETETETAEAENLADDADHAEAENAPVQEETERKIRMHTELDIGYVETPSDLLMLLQRTPIPFPGSIRITISREAAI